MKMDFIEECNNFGVSEKDFETTWCSRCTNDRCIRARKSLFAFRAANQMDTLFNPSRADPNDPEYEFVRRQEFNCLNPQEDHPTVTYPIEVSSPSKFKVHITQDEERHITRDLKTPKKVLLDSKPEEVIEDKTKLTVPPQKVVVEKEVESQKPDVPVTRAKELFIQPGAVVKMGG